MRNAEEAINTNVNLANLGRAFAGGVNQDVPFRNWLDANLFEGATFGQLLTERRPRVWINATDIYNRTPFVFGRTAFGAICSDLADYPVAGAVAASAAVPLAFSPVVLEAFPDRCNSPLPAWISRAADNPNASPILHAFAKGVRSYRDGSMKYIKLLDGGLVDNYGLSGFTIARESAEAPYDPMSRTEAIRLRRILFLVVDFGRGPQGDWAAKLEGPSGVELVDAVTGAALDASVRASYTAFEGSYGELARRSRALALRAVRCRRCASAWIQCRMELPRYQAVHRPARLRPTRRCTRRPAQRRSDPVPAAARDRRRSDRGRQRCAGGQPDLSGVPAEPVNRDGVALPAPDHEGATSSPTVVLIRDVSSPQSAAKCQWGVFKRS